MAPELLINRYALIDGNEVAAFRCALGCCHGSFQTDPKTLDGLLELAQQWHRGRHRLTASTEGNPS